ncbi:MAG: 5-formyltetrahydrofolate cyclo-ligase [Candidatus Tokpelaia sp.]|nr:MAG: 5-formyltetrahydrofolate cyclo-ligase [Candidatus Tokpelaia sp.]KAA6205406.1 MAG: 5-formyltetrahydrofolate cyclo-ligase [Candidatus Tokpelaia sp.]
MVSDKAFLRRRAQICRTGLTAAARCQAAKTLALHLPALLAFCAAYNRRNHRQNDSANTDIIAVYYPQGDEIDSRPLLQALQAQGKKTALPAVTKADKMLFRLWQAGDRLERHGLGFYQPPATASACLPHSILLPLLAFDACGNRLGRGGGHYDKAIAARQRQGANPPLIGLGFNIQELPAWQAEKHDIKLHAVLTETGLRPF